jgi:hypothetical protein
MTVEELRRLIRAPEIIIVDFVDDALAALRRILLVEHPTLRELDFVDKSLVIRRALGLLRTVDRLRRDLRAYRRAVDRAISRPPEEDLPF